MNLSEQLIEDVKIAMKAKDKLRLDTLRMLRAQIKDSQIAKGKELTDEEILSVMNNAGKKRREAIQLYAKSGRQDLLDQETRELEIIQAYLPAQLSREDIEETVTSIIAELGASTMKDLGKVMGAAMQKLKGRADGQVVQEISRKKLG